MIENEKHLVLVRTIIELAKAFGVKVLAEGVENKKQLEILKKLNCNYIQGFLCSKPLPEEELKETFLKNPDPTCKM